MDGWGYEYEVTGEGVGINRFVFVGRISLGVFFFVLVRYSILVATWLKIHTHMKYFA